MENIHTLPPELSSAVVVTTGNQLAEMLYHFLPSMVKQGIKTFKEEELQEKLLSPDNTRKLFTPAISLPTLDSYAEKGYFNKYYLEGRTWYKYSEVMAALRTIKKYERR